MVFRFFLAILSSFLDFFSILTLSSKKIVNKLSVSFFFQFQLKTDSISTVKMLAAFQTKKHSPDSKKDSKKKKLMLGFFETVK